MTFEFATASRIVFGPGKALEVPSAAAAIGKRALAVAGCDTRRALSFLRSLCDNSMELSIFSLAGEPKIQDAVTGARQARDHRADLVIGFGGGSVIDAAKAIAALATNPGDALDYLEVIGKGRPLTQPPLPCIAIPTTAGTGAEVTRNAVLASPEHRVKVSLRHPLMLPRVAIVDPQLTFDLPPALTAATGMDALTQLIEPYVSCRANPMTDGFCIEGIRRAARSLQRAFDNGHDAAAREDMALASLFGGLALANAGLGAVHGFAAPIGGMFPAPHGAVCAALLPHAMEANLRALRERAPGSDALRRFDEIARLLAGCAQAAADDGIEWVKRLSHHLQIAPLRVYGLDEADIPVLVEKGRQASSMKANPISLTDEELSGILQRAL